MVIEWTKTAKNDLYDFLYNAHAYTENTVKSYIKSLVDYATTLSSFPYLGKLLFHINSNEIRQLLYKKYRIIYMVDNDKVIILSVVHTSRDMNKFIKYLKKNFK